MQPQTIEVFDRLISAKKYTRPTVIHKSYNYYTNHLGIPVYSLTETIVSVELAGLFCRRFQPSFDKKHRCVYTSLHV